MKRIAIIVLVCLSTACDDRLPLHNKEAFITIQNNLGKDIFYKVAKTFPDTSIGSIEDIYLLTSSNGYVNYGLGKQSHEEYFAETPQGIISVFFFDSDTVKKYSKEEVAKQYKILIRKDLSYQELKNYSFHISYP